MALAIRGPIVTRNRRGRLCHRRKPPEMAMGGFSWGATGILGQLICSQRAPRLQRQGVATASDCALCPSAPHLHQNHGHHQHHHHTELQLRTLSSSPPETSQICCQKKIIHHRYSRVRVSLFIGASFCEPAYLDHGSRNLVCTCASEQLLKKLKKVSRWSLSSRGREKPDLTRPELEANKGCKPQ